MLCGKNAVEYCKAEFHECLCTHNFKEQDKYSNPTVYGAPSRCRQHAGPPKKKMRIG